MGLLGTVLSRQAMYEQFEEMLRTSVSTEHDGAGQVAHQFENVLDGH